MPACWIRPDPQQLMPVEVALAVLEREGHWLLQLRDDIEGIAHPGKWGLFGGHLDPGETPERALRRELEEEIGWRAGELTFRLDDRDAHRILHVFHGPLTVPLDQLRLQEGQDMVLATPGELVSGRVWSPRLGEFRPLAPSLQLVVRSVG